MAKQAKKSPDISKYSPKELEKLNKLNNLSNPAYRQKCLKLRPKFEELARKEGVTLKHIFTATPYSGRGKKRAYREGSKGTWPSLMATPVEEAPED
jgi:hypothetical protein